MTAHTDHLAHPGGHDGHHDDDGAAHGTFKSYMTGFVLAAILTAIPFWLVMDRVFEDSRTTALVILRSPWCRSWSTSSTSCTWTPSRKAAGTCWR